LNDVSIGACSCYEVGDPRNECSQSKSCDDLEADLSNVPEIRCACNGDNDPRRGITCAVSRMCSYNDLISTPCLCSPQYNSGNCTCTEEYHNDQQCICDQSQESGVYDLTSCRSTKICIGDNIPIGCTPLCAVDSNQIVELESCFCNQESQPINCRCPTDSSQLIGIPTDRCNCRQIYDPRDENLCKFQLKGVILIVNTSNVNPLRFTFYGERFQQGLLSVLIVELRNKTEEEIKLEKDNNKQFEEKYNTKKSIQTYSTNYNRNHKSNENQQNRLFESLTSSKFLKPFDRYLPNIIQNQEEIIRDKDGYIIWPPENAIQLPIFIDDVQIESEQNATFSMNDITWLDTRKKWYGMLISSDNETYYGANGNEGEAVIIDVVVEEGEQFVNFNKNQTSEGIVDPPVIEKPVSFPFWLKLLIIILASSSRVSSSSFVIIFGKL
ncbi:MAG: hypothetical protein EZS28_044107, partial [Streblomastix strix]